MFTTTYSRQQPHLPLSRRHSDSELSLSNKKDPVAFLTRQVSQLSITFPRDSLKKILDDASKTPITTAKTVADIFLKIKELFHLESTSPLQPSRVTKEQDIPYLKTIVTTLHTIEDSLACYPGRPCYLPHNLHDSAELLSTPATTTEIPKDEQGNGGVVSIHTDKTGITVLCKRALTLHECGILTPEEMLTKTEEYLHFRTKKKEFVEELKTNLSLPSSEYIANCIAITEQDGEQQLVLEYLREGDLFSAYNGAVKKHLTPEDYLSIAACITKSLFHLHTHYHHYHDMKPENVVLTKINDRYGAKLIDFGLTSYVGSQPQMPKLLYSKGTPAYFPPEYYQGKVEDRYCCNVQPCEASTIWSLGATLVEMILDGKQLISMLNPSDTQLYDAAIDGQAFRMKKSFIDRKLQQKIESLLTEKLKSYPPSPEINTFIEFLRACLRVDPKKRPTAQQLVTTYFSS